jgi:hypothetical protein
MDVSRVRPAAAGIFLADDSSTVVTGCRVSKATFMASSLPWSSCIRISRLVAERGSTLKTRGHQNICFGIQWNVMDGNARISVGNQPRERRRPAPRDRMRPDQSCNSVLPRRFGEAHNRAGTIGC